MFDKKNLKKTSVMFDEDDYRLFKQICKVNNSDASKTLRAFIEDYIKQNRQTAMKLKMT